MTGDDLRAWRKRHSMSVTAAARDLGVSTDTYARLERRAVVDRRTALACAAISYGLKPMGET